MILMCLSDDYDIIYYVFRVQLLIFNIVFILDVNVSMVLVYRSHAGQPFKSDQHYRHVVHVALVGIYWSIAIFAKMVYLNVQPLNVVPLGTDTEAQTQLGAVIAYFTVALLVDIVCFMLTIDTSFIKVVTLDFIKETQLQEQVEEAQE